MTTQRVIGVHAVRAQLRYDAATVEVIHVERGRRDARVKRLLDEAARFGVAVRPASRSVLDAMADGGVHQGVVAECAGGMRPALGLDALHARLDTLDHDPFLLILDQVQDPHNLGACLRTADAVAVDAVIAPRDKAVGLTPVVHKVASGAASSVAFYQVTNLARTLDQLKSRGILLIGCSDDAPASLYAMELTGPIGIVLGAEGQGMRRLTREACDHLVAIPMLGQVESLNVSVAAGVVLFEALRQRGPGQVTAG